MAYLHKLPGFKEMEQEFNKAGYKLDVGLGNDLIIEDEDGNWCKEFH